MSDSSLFYFESGIRPIDLIFLQKRGWYNYIKKVSKKKEKWKFFPLNLYNKDMKWKGIFLEPHPHNVMVAVEHLHELTYSDVIEKGSYVFLNSALSDKEGEFIKFRTASCIRPDTMGNLGGHRSNKDFEYREFMIKTCTLDSVFDQVDKKPDIVKLDIEGEEEKVINAYSFSHRPTYFMLECHEMYNKGVFNRLLNLFESKNYKMVYDEFAYNENHPNMFLIDKDKL